MANLVSRRPLQAISKITSKKNFPEIITFRYATDEDNAEEEAQATAAKSKGKAANKTKKPIDCDKVYLPDAGDATRNIKLLIINALDLLDNPNDTAAAATTTA